MDDNWAVSVDLEMDECVVKLSSPRLELNLRASRNELIQLGAVESADWKLRRSLQVGRCGGAPTWWSSDGSSVSLLVGNDDETWDIGVQMPITVTAQIVALARGLAAATT